MNLVTLIREARRCAAAAATAAMLVGCSYTGAATGPGVVTVQTPGVIPPFVLFPPAPGVGARAAAAEPMPREGAYAGTGSVLDDPGGACASLTGETRSLSPSNIVSFDGPTGAIHVHNFFVHGRVVTMGPFSGELRPDGSVTMQAGPAYVLGRFVGADFIGRFWQPQPGCTYAMMLRPLAG